MSFFFSFMIGLFMSFTRLNVVLSYLKQYFEEINHFGQYLDKFNDNLYLANCDKKKNK